MTEEQRQIDNMLLQMIQRHFPSLPRSDAYTDWAKWLGFARAAYDAGASSEREACAALVEAGKIKPTRDEGTIVVDWDCSEEAAAAIRARSNAGIHRAAEGRPVE